MDKEKVDFVYKKIKGELLNGAKWERYVAIQEQYLKNEDYESAEGLRLAFAEFGCVIHKHETHRVI